jgi:hypothetical protein
MKHVKGVEALTAKLDFMSAQVKERARNICHASAEHTGGQVVIDINTQKPNPDYDVPEGATGRRRHIPAPPGGPPNSDTGNLSARYVTIDRTTRVRVAAAIVAGVIYAVWQEYGTARMAARPHLLPRFREAGPRFRHNMREMLRSVAREAARSKTGRRQ